MQWYNPSNGTWDGQDEGNPSGAYLFKPKVGDQRPHLYSNFHINDILVGSEENNLVSEIVMYYRNDLHNTNQVYTAHVRLVEGSELLEWEIQMNGIPMEDGKVQTGMEVIAKWKLEDVSNSETFFTDSNGLEMQTRFLNQRPDFTLVTNMTVSSNYYPINSAIAFRDVEKSLQMTVMNDRSQGGAVIENGAIELMQNRRLLLDDNRGVAEPLNETDKEGRGIEVNAKYFIQIFDTETTPSLQR